jgi:Family of unknown function (DUF5752)
MNHFEIKDCALVTRTSGLPAAVNLRELRDRVASCHPDVLFHHFCETPLVPSFDYPDYRNDFAVWAKWRLGDQVLAERLAMIDPYSFPSLEDLRAATLEVIDDRLSEVTMIPWARPGQEFHFMQAITIVFDTGDRIAHPDELVSALGRMTNSSIYFHVLEARRRHPVGVDDFSAWLMGFDGQWSHYIQAMESIDVTFFTLPELRRKLIDVLTTARNIGQKGGRQ